ncbi:KaiC domain-containing protein [Halogeometricum limi]|uniref:KaiC domain protein, AF_0351 family n=1 Tax=Halogeometricum limi TaxID=555875 RepID=A0A1I6HEY3_9EURY|nr:KaiC domain-containing protein [Halogeometricum limi]SFR52847.1 KaiC domain protein, AF_0351 family [Halogeometricum limi]
MSDDDWFERAFADDTDGATASETEDGATDENSAADRRSETDAGGDDGAGPPGDADASVVDDASSSSADAVSESGGFENAFDFDTDGSEESLGFDAAESASDPFGGVRGEAAGQSRSGQSPNGQSDQYDPFPDDFAAAMKDAPAFGAGGTMEGPEPAGPSAETFGDEEFDSDIDRLDIGIEGLDEMILGGVPERSLMVAIGSAGTGKTTFGLQFLNEALQNGEKAVYITLEESRQRIFDTAEEKGWAFESYADEDRLVVIDLDPVEMANSLSNIQNDLPRLVADFDAERLVLDSVSLLEMMYDHPAERRSQVFDFARSLKEAGVTTLLTSEAKEGNAYSSRHGLVEYLADAVFVLQYVRPSDFRETRLAIEIQKIRDASHSRETKPYELTNGGISVYRQANIF